MNLRGKIFGTITGTILFIIPVISYSQGSDLPGARALTKAELFDEAYKVYKSLIAKEPKKGDNYYYLGENFLRSFFVDTTGVSLTEMQDSATVYFKKGTQVDPLNPLNFVGLGKIALFKNDAAGAKAQFDKALGLLPSKANKNSDVPKDRQALTKAKIAEALTIAPKKDLTQAYTLLQEAIVLDPKNPEIFIILGDAYLEDNDGTNSIANFKKAQELDPKSPLAKMKIGNIYVRSRNLMAAVPFFEEAVQIDPNFAPVYRELGELYYKAGKYEKAKANYQKFLELSPNISAKTRYATFLFLTKDYEGAIREINDVRKFDTTYNALNRLLAYSYFETKKYNEALIFIDKFLERAKPDIIIWSDHAYHGKILGKLGKDLMGIEKLKLAYQMDSANYFLLSDIAEIYKNQKDTNMVITYLQKKIDLGKGEIMDYYNVGKAYYQLKQFVKADTMFSYFVEKQPASMQGLIYLARAKVGDGSTMDSGPALPFYQKVIEKGLTDSLKYKNELIESYDYFGCYNISKKDYKQAKMYFRKILAIDPNHKRSNEMMQTKELKYIPD